MSWVLYPLIYIGSSWCFICCFCCRNCRGSRFSIIFWWLDSLFCVSAYWSGFVSCNGFFPFLWRCSSNGCSSVAGMLTFFFTSFALPSNAGYFCAVLLYSCTIVNIVWSLTETTLIKLHELGKRKLLLLPFVFTIESFEALLDCWLDMLFWACSWFISARLLIDSRY